jgi:DNA-binding NarL/FixJ family response regulator
MPFYNQIEITESFKKRYYITVRESEIISLLIKGFSNKEIGERLFISIKTVKNHITNIYQKTSTKNRLQLYNLFSLISK